jgi:hypothetical protein
MRPLLFVSVDKPLQTALYAQKRCTDTTDLTSEPNISWDVVAAHVLLRAAICSARSPQEVHCDPQTCARACIDRVPTRAAYRLKSTAKYGTVKWHLYYLGCQAVAPFTCAVCASAVATSTNSTGERCDSEMTRISTHPFAECRDGCKLCAAPCPGSIPD